VDNLDEKFLRLYSNRGIKALGKFPVLELVEQLTVAEQVVFHMGHHKSYPKAIVGKKNIGLFHNSILSTEIANVLRDRYNRDPLVGYIDYDYLNNYNTFANFDYVFVGHMHKAYGVFTVEDNGFKTRLRYLASLGRTNILEVNDLDLERVIPVFTVYENGELALKEEVIRLYNYAKTINIGNLESNEVKKELMSLYKEFVGTIENDVNPIDDVRSYLNNPLLCKIFDASVATTRMSELESMVMLARREVRIR
jgi:hypothetical protein